jgi:hypothetical protein
VWLARDGEHPRTRLRGERHRSGIVWREQVEAWRIRVSDELPLRVDLGLAFCEGRLDLGGLALTRVDLEGAFNDLRVSLPVPTSEVRLSLEGAFNDYEIEIPEGVPLRIDVEGLLNGVDGGSREGAGPGYRIDLEGAFNSVSVHSSEG